MSIWGAIGTLANHLLANRRHKKERQEKRSDDQTLSMQQTIEKLTAENQELKNRIELYEAVEQAPNGNYYILKINGERICPICWRKDHKAIPIFGDDGSYLCGGCGMSGIYDRDIVQHNRYLAEKENEKLQNYLNF